MKALRMITESHNHHLVIDLPASMENCRLEVIVIPAEQFAATVVAKKRHSPSPMLAGTVRLKDDLISPAAPAGDWDALQQQ
jgi:hypothetical protein